MKIAIQSLLLLSMSFLPQQEGDVEIRGLVYGENSLPLKDAQVRVLDASGKLMLEKTTSANGQFTFEVMFDQRIEIRVEKSGYSARNMFFDTYNLSEDDRKYQYGGFRIYMYPGDDQLPPELVTRISFDAASGNFVDEK